MGKINDPIGVRTAVQAIDTVVTKQQITAIAAVEQIDSATADVHIMPRPPIN